MTGRIGTRADYPLLDSLWAAGLSSVRQDYPNQGDVPPQWDQYLGLYGSTDAQGLRFGLAVRDEPNVFISPSFPNGLRLKERGVLFIGPRAGLSVSNTRLAIKETLRTWATAMRPRSANGDCLYGIIPKNWGRFGLFTILGWQTTPFDADSTICFDTIEHADATL